MKKRILAALVCAAAVLSLAGCSESESKNSAPNGTSSVTSTDGTVSSENGGLETSNAEESKPEKYLEATNVLYAGEILDIPVTPASDFIYEVKSGSVRKRI